MKKGKGAVILVILLAFLALCAFYAGVILRDTGNGDGNNIKLGLDLAGGVSITYQAVGDVTAEQMNDTVYKLQLRIEETTGSTEVSVYQEGDDRINVEVPGVTNANELLEALGQPGTLEIQDTEGNVIIDGSMIETAEAGTSQDSLGNNQYVVKLTFTDEGTQTFADYTSEHVGEYMPIYYDGEIVSYPVIKEAITDGTALISGMEDYEAAETLASYLRIGSLDVELEELRSNVVGASLGQEAISTSLLAGAIGLVIVMIFMIAVYWILGVAASIALALYTAMIIVGIYAFDITLTLPGIAGIILSIGMAVDANVIIFARIREELTAGQTVSDAINIGFKKALSAIVDGNVTTFIAALVLIILGSGSVKGFAYTLALGIVLSMITALLISRWLVKAFYALGCQDAKYYGRLKTRNTINFLKRKPIFFGISLACIVAGFIAMGVHSANGENALKYSLEFLGGTSTQATFSEDYTIEEIEANIVPVVSSITGDNDIQTQKVQDSTDIIIKTRELDLDERTALVEALVSQFGVDEDSVTCESISATISNEMRQNALVAILVAVVCMLVYIWFRFKDLRFGTSAVLALCHDVLVVLAFYAIARISVSNTFIACMLTIVGYSINATIVIFDRIRENMRSNVNAEQLEGIVNDSITQTLTRSIYTSLTTFIMVLVLYILGVASIREFALPLMVGIICGAYSSVCVTGALWYVFKTRIGKNRIKRS